MSVSTSSTNVKHRRERLLVSKRILSYFIKVNKYFHCVLLLLNLPRDRVILLNVQSGAEPQRGAGCSGQAGLLTS